jgi:hypothetical protein
MPRITLRRATAIALAAGWAAVAGLASCRGGNGVTASGTADSTTSVAADPIPPTTGRSSTSGRATTSSSKGSGKAAVTTSTTTAGRPQAVVARQGDRVVAVFVATAASFEDASLTRAIARLQSLGYTAYSSGDTGCSRGAREALPRLGQYAVSVEFATRADADRFAALYGAVVGIATVTVYCAD